MQNYCKKFMFWIHLKKKNDSIISLEKSLNAPAIYEIINSWEGFFTWWDTVKSLLAIHCIRLFPYSRNTLGCRTEVNLPEIRAKLVFSLANTAFTLLVR